VSPPVQAARNYTHHRHLLLLLSPKADTHFTIPQRVVGWVDLAGWLHTEMVYPSTDSHPSGTNRIWRSATTLIGQCITTKPNRQPNVMYQQIQKIKWHYALNLHDDVEEKIHVQVDEHNSKQIWCKVFWHYSQSIASTTKHTVIILLKCKIVYFLWPYMVTA